MHTHTWKKLQTVLVKSLSLSLSLSHIHTRANTYIHISPVVASGPGEEGAADFRAGRIGVFRRCLAEILKRQPPLKLSI